MGRYEWIILEVGFVGLLVWELWRVRRDIRRAREAEAEKKAPAPVGAGSGRATPSGAPGMAASPGPTGG